MQIKKSRFRGGAHIQYNKELTAYLDIENCALPPEVILPMVMNAGAPCEPIVAIGDKVKKGQKVADADAFVSVPIHAPISGEVVAIEERLHPNGQMVKSIVIKNDMQETLHESIQPRKSYQDLTRQEIIDIIREAGVIGKGGAAYPLHAKLTIPEDKQVEYLILNGAECEAYLTSDDAAMKSNADEIIKGLEIVMYVLNVSHAIIGIEDNKPLAIERIAQASKRLSEDYRIDIYSLDTKYPHGYKKNIITSIAKFESPSGMRSIDTGCVVMNVSTAVALKRAVMDGMPLIEKIYTVSGRGIAQPKMIYAKIGTTVDHIIQQCGGVNENARKFVIDGPMMGISHFSTHIPVLKGNIGLLFLTDKEIDITTIRDCIRCGKCVDHCPVRLMPSMLSEFALYEEYEKAEKHQVMECIECGTCAYVCPAKRPLTSNIRMARQQIKTKKRARKTG